MPTVGIVESLISETSHQKDSLHTPDHNIILTEASTVATLFMGELENDITQCKR